MPNVQVAIRCRPKLDHESGIPSTKIEVNENANTIAVLSQNNAKTFKFDKVFSESASQQDIFDYVTPMVDHVLNGLHATVFAYGQTGSGKTFTMDGFNYAPSAHGSNAPKPRADTPAYQHGVVPRLIQLLFDRARERMGGDTADDADAANVGEEYGSTMRFKLKCSFMQLYNEKITDLLNPKSTANNKEGLKIRWTKNDQFVVENLFTFECDSPDQMREMFMMGIQEKVMGSHHMNLQSSRSHSLFTIHVHSWDANAPDLVRKSELTLVDLAGSEKLHLLSQNPSQQLLKESIEINTSLLALGKVITALATNSKQHIPYRDSKLTKLLKHALGGNSVTAMIACCNPLDPYVEETVSTLLYASRARNITNDPRVNENPQSALIRQLREEISSLKMELEYYRQLVATGVVDDGLAKRLANKLDREGIAAGGGRQSEKMLTDSPEPRKVGEIVPSRDAGGSVVSNIGNSGEVVRRSETETELAEKLTESCNILKSLMGVNAQLRTAFDRIKAAKEAVDKRELAVNAENTALRERIEMLESIAMNEATDVKSNEASDEESDAPASTKVKPPSQASNSTGFGDSNGRRSVPNNSSKPSSRPSGTSISKPPQQRKLGPYAQKLQDYANKYRNPTKSVAYEDYYGSNQMRATGGQSAQGRQRFDTTITTEAEERKSKEVAQLLDKLASKLPKQTIEMVPRSLQDAKQFGSLAFGGQDSDVQQMEERRRQRQERLAKLQAQNASLGGAAPPALRFQPAGNGLDNLMVMANSPVTDGRGRAEQPRFSQLAGGSGGGGGGLNFGMSGGGTDRLLRPSSATKNTSASLDTSSALSHHPSGQPSSSAEKLFAYLSQEEMKGAFTADQLAKLQSRNSNNNAPTSNAPNGLSAAQIGSRRGPTAGHSSSAPSTPIGGLNSSGRVGGRPHGQSSQLIGGGSVPDPQPMRSSASHFQGAYGSISTKSSAISASATANLISRLSGMDNGVNATSATYSVSTPRSKSSYDMGIGSSNQSSGDRGRTTIGGNLASLGYGGSGAMQQPGGVSAMRGPQHAPHEAMHRREQQQNEQQRYQQQIYEAQQALIAQQQKLAQQRR